MKKIISVLLVFLLLFSSSLSFAACREEGNKEKHPATHSKAVSYLHFNTVTILSSYGNITKEEFNEYVKTVDEMLGYYHKLFDIYHEYSGVNNLCTINKMAGKEPVVVDEELIDFLLYCQLLYTITNGKTNVMLGSVLSIWHDAREIADSRGGYLNSDEFPSTSALLEANQHTSIELLVINKEEKTAYISDADASIDVGAIAKGYAAAKAAKRLKEMGADSMALNAGGNIIPIGLRPDGSNWVIGITNPDKTSGNSFACRVEIGETSLVTSGDYERYFICDGAFYHHIIDPETLMPANYFASVSIFTPQSGLADALSTALFCMSYEDGLSLVESLSRVIGDDVEVLWIYQDGTMKYTDGICFVN